ncbi:MAG TPA: DUF4870 domain-containing protein [Mycobacteriales bacterium]|nr:DUF4870 domain-containing protein [Mycobacteriales bacterium]
MTGPSQTPPAGDPWGAPPPGGPAPSGPPQAGPPAGWDAPSPWSAAPAGPTGEDTTWALLGHLSWFVLALVGPLVVYLVKKDSSPYVRHHAAEALNFHITVTLACIVSGVLVLLLVGILLLAVVLLGASVLAVVAALKAARGELYRYPLTLRLVR